MTVPMVCLDCGIVSRGRRCPSCQRRREAQRNQKYPYRLMYRDPAYVAFIPSGLCYWCGEAPATERDHVVPLSQGGDNSPNNIVGACTPCNQQRAAANKGAANRKRRARPTPTRYCPAGHDKDEVGRFRDGQCMVCKRAQNNAAQQRYMDRKRMTAARRDYPTAVRKA